MRQIVMDFLDGAGADVLTTRDIHALGIGQEVVRALVRERVLVRIIRGVYVRAARLDRTPEDARAGGETVPAEARHLFILDALLRGYGDTVGASHHTAALAWSMPVLAGTLDTVHLSHTRAGTTGRRHDAFTIHRCDLDKAFTELDGRRLVVPALAVIGTALLGGLKAGLVAADGALRAGQTTREELEQRLTTMRRHPGMSMARAVVARADPSSESAGETLLRLVLQELGIVFEAQHWIRTSRGYSRVDFYLPELGVVLEFDGLKKYATARERGDQGRAGGNPLAEEKLREDAVRALGYGVGRVVWSGLDANSVASVIRVAASTAQPHARHHVSEPPPWVTRGHSRDDGYW